MKLTMPVRQWVLSLFIIFGFLFPDMLLAQEPGLYFTHEKNFDFSKVETFDSFAPGDTIYGLLLVPPKSEYSYQLSLESFTIDENGDRVVPVTLRAGSRDVTMNYKVPLSSGIKKKSGLAKLITMDGVTNGFYFRVFPTGSDGINDDWAKWFGMIVAYYKKPEISVTIGPASESLKSVFTLDLSRGPGIYSNWGAAFLNDLKKSQDDQKRKEDSVALAKQNKKIADSLEAAKQIQELIAESDKSPVPVSKIKKPALEPVLLAYAKADDPSVEYLRAYIYSDEGYHSDHEYVVNFAYRIKNDHSGLCYLLPAKVKTENPLGEKEYGKEITWYSMQSRQNIRCSRITSAQH